jgi:hypothetical protein
MPDTSLSPECKLLLEHFCSMSVSDEWAQIDDAVEALDLPLEKLLPRVQELVSKGYLGFRTGSRQPGSAWGGLPRSVVVTSAGRQAL